MQKLVKCREGKGVMERVKGVNSQSTGDDMTKGIKVKKRDLYEEREQSGVGYSLKCKAVNGRSWSWRSRWVTED